MTDETEPETLVWDILRNQWDKSATLDIKPLVKHGWVSDDGSQPEVTISNPDESPINGGDTGYSGMSGDGSGPTQTISGTVAVNCWADRERLDSDNTNINPRQYVAKCKSHIKDLCKANATAPTSLHFSRVSYMGSYRDVEPERTPTMWHYHVTVGYGEHE